MKRFISGAVVEAMQVAMQRLIDLVTGGDKPGSSTFWSYQDSLQALQF